MAVAFEGNFTRTSEYRCFPEELIIKPGLNGRHDEPDISELIASILRDGQIQPVCIRKDGDRAVLTKGFNRWKAISQINKRKLAPVKMQIRCVYTQETEQEAYIGNIAENRFRNATTEYDDIHNVKILMNRYGMTEEQVAEVYFPSANSKEENKEALQWVRGRIQLISLSPEAAEAFREGRIKPSAARAIAKLSEDQQREAVKKPGNVKAKDIREASGKPQGISLKNQLRAVINSGEFTGIGGKIIKASDDFIEFLGRLVN